MLGDFTHKLFKNKTKQNPHGGQDRAPGASWSRCRPSEGRGCGGLEGAWGGQRGFGRLVPPARWGQRERKEQRRPSFWRTECTVGAQGPPEASGRRAMSCLRVGFVMPGGLRGCCSCEHLPASESEGLLAFIWKNRPRVPGSATSPPATSGLSPEVRVAVSSPGGRLAKECVRGGVREGLGSWKPRGPQGLCSSLRLVPES